MIGGKCENQVVNGRGKWLSQEVKDTLAQVLVRESETKVSNLWSNESVVTTPNGVECKM